MENTLESVLQHENWARKQSGPLYAQLRDHIADAIRTGVIGAGDSLPSEREIAELSGVSRITVRKAFKELVRDGLVIQKQGSGTSVTPVVERVQQSLSILSSFTEDMARRGKHVHSELLERGLYPATLPEIMTLSLPPDSMVARISRLRIADGVPLAIERASLSPAFLPDPQNVGQSLYAHLDKYGCRPSRALQRISAINLGADDAELLDVNEGVAGLNIERISYLPNGETVEFTRSIYRGDAYDFLAELHIQPASDSR